jgi:SpoVK/Ycf46/Vps4 family AAA+-type ATPase
MLEAAEEMVVLFDEFDELVRERDEEGSDSASRFLTTAMLPKLTALSSRRRIVYLLATNHLERFDSAVRRPGRFDLIVPVMPPTLDSKLRRWPEVAVRLRAVRIGTRAKADKELRGKLGGLTYLEFEDLVPRLLKARTRRTVERVVEEADARAILNQSPTNDDHTWLKRIESETKRIRI